MSAATSRLPSPVRPRLWSSSGLDCCASDSAAGVLTRQPADQERQRGGEMVSLVEQVEALRTHLKCIYNKKYGCVTTHSCCF